MNSPGSRPCGGARVAPPADGLVLYSSARSSQRSVQSSESNELPTSQPASPKPAGCPEKERTRRSKYRAPSAGIGCSDGICESTTDRDATPTESELAKSDHGDSGQEEGEVTQAEGDEPGSFTQMKSRDTDSRSEDTTPGRDSWRSARGRETVMLTTPRPRGRGKCHME